MRTRSPLPLKIYWTSVDNLDLRMKVGEVWQGVGHLQRRATERGLSDSTDAFAVICSRERVVERTWSRMVIRDFSYPCADQADVSEKQAKNGQTAG